ncbi:MAG TPA: long-chain fatty acid--CoA ligase [Actinomycetota bacterium]
MNLAVLGERHLERFGVYEQVFFEGRWCTNAELVDRSARLAASLAGLGVAPGDRVAVMLPNSPDVGTCYGAILRCGAVVVPVIFLLAPPEIRHIVADCEAKVIFTSPEFAANVLAGIDGLERPPIVVVTDQAPEGTTSFEQLLADATETMPIVDRNATDLAVISYTSGTTGKPKGVMLTHSNLLFNAQNSAKVASIADGDISISTLPLAHLFGLGNTLVGQLFKLQGVILRWFTPEGFFEAMNHHRAQSTAMVPAMVQLMLAHPGFDDVDWSSLRYAIVAAAPVPVEMAAEFEKRTGARVLQGYGLTETSPTVSVMHLDDPPKPGSCGRPAPNVEVAILDDDDRPLPPGEAGEVCVLGPNVMAGYYNMPEETEAVLLDGWFHTGDIGHLDEDGFLYITDRKKDLIIRGGFNIVPRDIEEILHGHPAVMECAVVGIPDATMGEEIKAFVVLRPGQTATQEELLDLCRRHLAKHKTPRFVSFVDALPRNAVGKVLKRDLRARA